jgi:transcriptional regulator with XRE-family HTH domain
MPSQAMPRRLSTTNHAARLRFQLMAVEMAERVGARMRERREELGLTQAKVAEKIDGVTPDQISRWERGKHMPRDLKPVADALEVTESYFYAPAPDKTETPDLLGKDSESQLDRVERQIAELHRKLDRLTPLLPGIAELVGLDDETGFDDPTPPASR